MRIVSFDIGTRNLGCVVINTDVVALEKLKRGPGKLSSEALNELVIELSRTTRIEKCILFDLAQTTHQKLTNSMYLRLFDWLSSLQPVWQDCDQIIVESQLARNFKASSVMHCVKSWFLIQFRDQKPFTVFPSKHKTHLMGAQSRVFSASRKWKPTTKAYRKNFCKALTHKCLEATGDSTNLKLIFEDHKKKQDDLCDCFVQALAFLMLNYVM